MHPRKLSSHSCCAMDTTNWRTRGVGCSILDNLGASLALARADLAELEGTRRPSFLKAVALRYAQFSNKT